MSILVNKNTRVVVQGITGKEGSFHATQCKAYGTKMVAGVTPGKAGQEVEGIPVFNTVADAVRKTECDTSLIFVPPPFCADAILEAADAGVKLIICITEGIPVNDMVKVTAALSFVILTPPALPRPPAWICAFTTNTGVFSSPAQVAAASGDVISFPRGTGTPNCANNCLA